MNRQCCYRLAYTDCSHTEFSEFVVWRTQSSGYLRYSFSSYLIKFKILRILLNSHLADKIKCSDKIFLCVQLNSLYYLAIGIYETFVRTVIILTFCSSSYGLVLYTPLLVRFYCNQSLSHVAQNAT